MVRIKRGRVLIPRSLKTEERLLDPLGGGVWRYTENTPSGA